MTFDRDFCPINLNINRTHLLIQDYVTTKFEFSSTKTDLGFTFTSLRAKATYRHSNRRTDRPTDRHLQSNTPPPPFFKGINTLSSITYNTTMILQKQTHIQKLSNTTFFRRHCFGSCRTEYTGNGNKIF